MKKLFAGIAAFLMTLLSGHSDPSASPPIVRITSQITYAHEIDKNFLVPGKTAYVDSLIVSGAGFFLTLPEGYAKDAQLPSNVIYVTAAHLVTGPTSVVIEFPKTQRKLDLGESHTKKIRNRIGFLSLRPIKWCMSEEDDVAVFLLPKAIARDLGVRPLSMSTAKLKPRLKLGCWGFPGTANKQLVDSITVAEVKPGFFILSSALEAGFSGGPAVDLDTGKVLGVIARSTKKQARVVKITQVLSLLKSNPLQPYHDPS